MKFGVGQSVPRKEDPRLITGQGQFTDDLKFPGELYVSFYRSPYSHGRIELLDVEAVRAAPGVRAVYTAADLSQLGYLPCRAVLKDRDGNPCFIPDRPILAEEVVRFVGQAVVAVVAESRQAARDAAELTEFEIEDLPVTVDLSASAEPDAPVIHPEIDSNICIHWEKGDADAVADAIEGAVNVVDIDIVVNRVAPSPLEPRTCVGIYEDDRYTLYNPSQGAFAQQGVLAKSVFNVPLDQMRVVSLDTGGGFGIRGEVQPEPCVCLFAARELGCPVKWTGDRSEMFLTDSHGRDNVTRGTLAFDADGRTVALRVETLANLGAFCSAVGPFVPTMGGGKVTGSVYKIPNVYQSVRCVFTNTMPVAAYRGAGRPEACYVAERLFEKAAIQLGIDSVELRLKNFIEAVDFPYTNPFGEQIASGAFAETLQLALQHADFEGFKQRRAESEAAGKLRGIGIGYYMEASGGGVQEEARVTLRADGVADVVVGTFSHGQGHRTAYSQIVAENLGIPFEKVNIIQGDTDQVKFGGGTGGSRSSQMGGVAVLGACDGVVEEGKPIAAVLLQSDAAEVTFEASSYRSRKNDAQVSLDQVARAAMTEQFRGEALNFTHRYDRGSGFTFPNGCHVAEIEVDRDTGVVEVDRYHAMDDCGRVINPLLAAGQVHGGVAQGLGQALFENVVYADDGQLLTGSLMDYGMPRAAQLPDINVQFNEVLDPGNPLGVKGIGEGGACGAPGAIVNAVLNALQPLGVTAIDMPLNSEKIWRLMNKPGSELV